VVSSGTTGLARFRSVSAHNTKHAGVNRIIGYGKIATGEKREREKERAACERERESEKFLRKNLVEEK